MLCLRAPSVPADELIYGARLVDVAPTVLHLLGLPVEDLDGRALTVAANPAPLSPDSQGLATQFLAMVASDPASPASEQEQFQLAGVYMSTGRPHLALPLLETLAAEAPEEIRYQRTLAQCCLVLGRVEQAETLLNTLIEGQEPHAWAYFLRGVIYSHRRQSALAVADLENAASLGENSPALHAFLGNIYLSKRLTAQAEAAYGTALRLDPASPDALSGMAALHNLRRNPERAAELALEAIGLRYETPAAHLQLGIALARLSQWQRAAVAFRATLALAPGVKSAARYLDVVNARLLPHQRA
jgi:Flp pilus assembly protein TadD